jgi:two-component system, sensor histidine kinase and response regulator
MISSAAQRPTILIVDDQEENLRVVGTVLTAIQYDVVPATSVEQAYKRLASRKPDLILLDVLMPETDGLEMCRSLQADPRWQDIPVIFLSAADDKNLVVQALEAGGVDYVTKPFNKAELVSRVRTQITLKQARDQLRMLAEDKDEILGILAHDLKNHLAGMTLSAGLLQERAADLPPRCATLVENIARSSERMTAFVKEFLANQSAERLQVSLHPLNLCDALEGLIAAHQPAALAKKIVLTLETPEEPVIVRADHEALRQVMENLVSNAIKFTPERGTVTVSATSGALGGPGFTEADREKMFRRYGRLSARPTGGEPSTGLGLSIVKRLVEAMSGRIALDDPGADGGAVFVLSLPIANESDSVQ